MYEDARKYLAKVVHWPDYAGNEYVNIHNSFQSDKYDKPGWGGRACHTLGDAINYIDWSLKADSTLGIYACMSTQATCEENTNRVGGITRKAKRSAETALHLKSLFLDCDFKGGEHGYDDEKSALAALADFLKASGFPKPSCIVHSGGGLHIYWTVDRALTVAEWLPLAYALAEATKKHGFKCDTQCTVDAARILRVPNTSNKKSEPHRPVTLLYVLDFDYAVSRLEGVLAPYVVPTPSLPQAVVGLDPVLFPPKPPIENDLGAGLEKENQTLRLDDVAKECAFVREAISTGGKSYSQPMWNLTSLIATFTDDPVADMHRMSDKHPTYTKEASDEMLARKQRERETKGLGWPSCASISAAGCVACQSCPHFAKGKTPLHFAVPIPVGGVGGVQPNAAVTPQVTELPSGYFVNQRGLIAKVVDEEQAITIADYTMEDPQLHSNSPEQFSFLSQIERGKKRRVYIDLKSIGAMDMRSVLHEQGFMLQSGAKHVNMVADFMTSWIKLLRETRDSVVASPFGWTQTTGKEPDGFAFGEMLWTPSGPKVVSCSDPVLAKGYKVTGEEDVWLQCAKLVTDQKRPALQAMLATAFAGPLIRFTGEPGALVSAVGDTGIGKSSTMTTAMAVWGHPKTTAQALSTTENSAMGRMGSLKSIPIFWDEIHNIDQMTQFVNMTFQTTQGVGKGRMNRNLKQREPGQWQTLLVLSSNIGLLDFMSRRAPLTAAGHYRVFEFEVAGWSPHGNIIQSDASRLYDELRYNHSHIGLKYAQWLGSNFARCDKDVGDELRNLIKEFQTIAPERFWLVAVAPILVGARYANELGFTEFDIPAMKKFLCAETLPKLRREVQQQPGDMKQAINVSSVMAAFFAEMRGRHMLFTNRIHRGQGKPRKDDIKVATSHCSPQNIQGVYVQYGVEDGTLRFSRTALKKWCEKNDVSPFHLMRSMVDMYKAQHVDGILASGVPQFRGGQEFLYEIDTTPYPELNFS